MSQPEFPTVVDDNPELQPASPKALAVVQSPPSMAVGAPISAPLTPEQAKVNAIADLTHSAYAKASTLALTAEEQSALQKDFPDEAFKPGAAGKESLIYIEHAFLRDRFNQVFGPGQWALIPRSRWAEDFTAHTRNGDLPASRVYVEAMLLVRGCFVAEAVGDMVYWKNNESQNYGDACEGAKTAALRRCCKELGVGLQAWKKDFCDGWWARKRNSQKREPSRMPQDEKGGIQTPGSGQSKPLPVAGKASGATIHPQATPETRQKLIERLMALQNVGEEQILEYFRKLDNPTVLLPTEGLLDLPLEFVPVTQKQFEALKVAIVAFTEGISPAKHAFPPNPVGAAPAAKAVEVPRDKETATPEAVEAWRAFPMPWGKQAGVPLGELEKPYLFGLWANFKVELEYNGKPKKPETIAKDETFRKMLDDAGLHYKFEKKD